MSFISPVMPTALAIGKAIGKVISLHEVVSRIQEKKTVKFMELETFASFIMLMFILRSSNFIASNSHKLLSLDIFYYNIVFLLRSKKITRNIA